MNRYMATSNAQMPKVSDGLTRQQVIDKQAELKVIFEQNFLERLESDNMGEHVKNCRFGLLGTLIFDATKEGFEWVKQLPFIKNAMQDVQFDLIRPFRE